MEPSLADPSSRITEALKATRALIFPIDGVLNGGRIIFDSRGEELCTVSVRDAVAIREAVRQGLLVSVFSGRPAEGYRPFLEGLGVRDIRLGGGEFLDAYEAFREGNGLDDEACACIGDDVGEVSVLERVGLPVTPINGADWLRNRVGYISAFEGGRGCVREVVEMILGARGLWPWVEPSAGEG
ncbi:3-deoxy-D-manno-octulosonate 8-phosphate phosphatase [Chlorobium sp. N1]|uniref:KdsC family phosphatase n=1 Tax=Chlorobium sp. N1 TaxID=2491138 RepID=UPI00103B1781|nr:3-deoxy-D-manno-octulosonate 8-phosphate phosphatase [Chlorobium sp. N1]TCD48302.1 3-deoxy-D-manno-octulosonate 8-phosphate phosphatase [Chlorobium sp. N1]